MEERHCWQCEHYDYHLDDDNEEHPFCRKHPDAVMVPCGDYER